MKRVDKMTVKQLERQYDKLAGVHQENLQYWREAEADLAKTLKSLENHSEQIQTFSSLQLSSSLEITKEFPHIKDQLLEKLSNLSLQLEMKLGEYHDTLSDQRSGVEEMMEKCVEISSSLPVTQMVEVKPAELSLATKLELAVQLSQLYNSLELGVASWREHRHRDQTVWRIHSHLSQLWLSPS